jgi:hypothetical protein
LPVGSMRAQGRRAKSGTRDHRPITEGFRPAALLENPKHRTNRHGNAIPCHMLLQPACWRTSRQRASHPHKHRRL